MITPDQVLSQVSEYLAKAIDDEIARNAVFVPVADWATSDDGTPTVVLNYNDGRSVRVELRCESSRRGLRYWVELVKLEREVKQ